MQLFTCSYSAWRPELGAPVRASLGAPRFLPGALSWPLAWEITPRGSYFRASADEFDRQYIGQLERYGARRIARRLHQVARSGFAEPADRLVILCFEPSEVAETVCHRRVWAEWWLHATGERIPELTKNGPVDSDLATTACVAQREGNR